MRHVLSHPLLVLAVAAGACWDGWRWYLMRIAASPEEGIALAVTIILLLASHVLRGQRWWRVHPVPLLPVAALLASYAVARTLAPPIVSSAVAIAATLYTQYRVFLGERPGVAFLGLIALALPVLPSFQFVFGYPMRVVSATLTVALLRLQGLAVQREGTYMLWGGETIQFDAPCSGINMLWACLMLTLMVCVIWRSGTRMVIAAVCAALLMTIAANVLRAASLFYIEAGLLTGAAPWWHEAIGLAAFSSCAIATLWVLTRLRAREAST